MKLTHLFIANACYSGKHKEMIDSRAEYAANMLNLPLVKTNTNLADAFVDLNHNQSHYFRAFFSILSLRKLWKTYYFSTGVDFSHFSLNNSSTKDTVFIELLLNEIVSVHGFRVYSGGVDAERHQKIQSLINYPITYDLLHVCLYPANELNCGDCDKCIRTLLALDVYGALDLYKKSFNIDKYLETRLEKIQYLVKGKKNSFLEPIYIEFLKVDPELIKQVEALT